MPLTLSPQVVHLMALQWVVPLMPLTGIALVAITSLGSDLNSVATEAPSMPIIGSTLAAIAALVSTLYAYHR